MKGPAEGACRGVNSDRNCGAAVIESLSFSPLCPLDTAHGKPRKFRIMTGDGGDRGGVYPAPTAVPMVEVVETEGRRGGGPYKASRKGQSGWRKEKFCIRVLDIFGDTPTLPK